MFAQGDTTCTQPAPKCLMAVTTFDSLMRQDTIDDASLNVADNLEEFGPLPAEELDHLAIEAERLYNQSERAIMMVIGGIGFGDIALVPGPTLKQPQRHP